MHPVAYFAHTGALVRCLRFFAGVWRRGVWARILAPFQTLALVLSYRTGAFIDPLKKASKGYNVWLSCPQAKEDICLLVGQFIDMFKEGGWTVRPEVVRRDAPGIPFSGVRLIFYAPDPPQPLKPGEGVWTKMPFEYMNLVEAFKAIHINPELVRGNTVPQDSIGIYFGPDM